METYEGFEAISSALVELFLKRDNRYRVVKTQSRGKRYQDFDIDVEKPTTVLYGLVDESRELVCNIDEEVGSFYIEGFTHCTGKITITAEPKQKYV